MRYCVCMKGIVFCNYMCFSCFSASHIQDFGPCHDVKSQVCCNFLIPSENRFGHFKEELKRQVRVVLRKNIFAILCYAVRKWNKLSNLPLLITHHSSVYSVYLFYLFFSYTHSGRSLFPKSILLGWRLLTPKLGRLLLDGSIFTSLVVTEQQSRVKHPCQ